MADRRYNDKEIAAIFRAATEGPPPASAQPDVPRDEGLTLTDLLAIGREVGISPDEITRAAQALDVRRGAARTLLGLPLGVSRTVNLNRRLTEEEWGRLVVQLREVFDARGSTRVDGPLRQWTNGNLQVLLEPTETGHRLRFRTLHGAARASISIGFVALGAAAAVAITTGISGTLGDALSGVVFLLTLGVGMVANGALRLPRWARLRGRQMDALAAQVADPKTPRIPDSSTEPGE